MDDQIRIRPASIEEVIKIGSTVFSVERLKKMEDFERQYGDKDKLISVAYVGDNPAGYAVWYDKFGDGSFYCWLTGVDPEHRRKGVLKGLMAFGQAMARSKGYKKLKTKARNSEKGMIAYLAKYGFEVTDFEKRPDNKNSKIYFEKELN